MHTLYVIQKILFQTDFFCRAPLTYDAWVWTRAEVFCGALWKMNFNPAKADSFWYFFSRLILFMENIKFNMRNVNNEFFYSFHSSIFPFFSYFFRSEKQGYAMQYNMEPWNV